VYTVRVTVTDDDTAAVTASFKYVVVYDPSAGFVTGGGWIDSPAGAYAANPALTGNANFGFVAKYQQGANTPTGNTEFQFQAGEVSRVRSNRTRARYPRMTSGIDQRLGNVGPAAKLNRQPRPPAGQPDPDLIREIHHLSIEQHQ
jgi:hypothetical protein